LDVIEAVRMRMNNRDQSKSSVDSNDLPVIG
jgi:hypothetical protein